MSKGGTGRHGVLKLAGNVHRGQGVADIVEEKHEPARNEAPLFGMNGELCHPLQS